MSSMLDLYEEFSTLVNALKRLRGSGQDQDDIKRLTG